MLHAFIQYITGHVMVDMWKRKFSHSRQENVEEGIHLQNLNNDV
jgi:hypothetical protein